MLFPIFITFFCAKAVCEPSLIFKIENLWRYYPYSSSKKIFPLHLTDQRKSYWNYIRHPEQKWATGSLNIITHQEDGNPGQSYIVKRYRPLERIVALTLALRVVLIPVNTGNVGRLVSTKRYCRFVALQIADFQRRNTRTQMHPVVLRPRADIISILVQVLVVRREWPGKRKKEKQSSQKSERFSQKTTHPHQSRTVKLAQ